MLFLFFCFYVVSRLLMKSIFIVVMLTIFGYLIRALYMTGFGESCQVCMKDISWKLNMHISVTKNLTESIYFLRRLSRFVIVSVGCFVSQRIYSFDHSEIFVNAYSDVCITRSL